jgi:hypothetical protein
MQAAKLGKPIIYKTKKLGVLMLIHDKIKRNNLVEGTDSLRSENDVKQKQQLKRKKMAHVET